MERGQLAIENRLCVVFVFEGLIGTLNNKRSEKVALKAHQWSAAVEMWELDYRVCDYINALILRYDTPVDVVTWKPHGFAVALADRLWGADVPVRSCKDRRYPSFSQHMATDTEVQVVYDADPAHRFGYGYKAREFFIGRV